MFSHFSSNDNGRKFDVMKREANGFVHKVGVVNCANKVQADTRARMLYGRFIKQGEAIWCVDPYGVAA